MIRVNHLLPRLLVEATKDIFETIVVTMLGGGSLGLPSMPMTLKRAGSVLTIRWHHYRMNIDKYIHLLTLINS